MIRMCGLTTGTPQEGANSTGGTAFLLVPVPAVPCVPVCND